MRFRAAVLHAFNEPLILEEVTLPAPGPGDVLVRNHASALCHTDLEVMQGSLPYLLPVVLGHEGAGVVEAVGSAVRSGTAESRISPSPLRSFPNSLSYSSKAPVCQEMQ